jgi:hypothetical protein
LKPKKPSKPQPKEDRQPQPLARWLVICHLSFVIRQ